MPRQCKIHNKMITEGKNKSKRTEGSVKNEEKKRHKRGRQINNDIQFMACMASIILEILTTIIVAMYQTTQVLVSLMNQTMKMVMCQKTEVVMY